MRKAKTSLKNISFRKYGEVVLGDIILPIKTLSIAEEIKATISFPNEIPRKLEKPSEEMKKRLTDSDPKYNEKMYPMMRVYDIADPKYLEIADKIQRYSKTLEAIKFIDFDATIDDEGKISLYDDLGVKAGDWFSICQKFEDMGLGAVEFEKIINKAKELQGETLFEKLGKIQQITEMDTFALLMKLEAIVDKENTKTDPNLNKLIETFSEQDILKSLKDIELDEETTEEMNQMLETDSNEKAE